VSFTEAVPLVTLDLPVATRPFTMTAWIRDEGLEDGTFQPILRKPLSVSTPLPYSLSLALALALALARSFSRSLSLSLAPSPSLPPPLCLPPSLLPEGLTESQVLHKI
jgi:hypothetical protein